jgi:hypothetical protein
MESKIFDIIVSSMIIAQKEKFEDKKEYVLLEIQKYLSIDQYERYKPFISLTIDGIKYLSRSNLLKNLKNSKCCIN